MCLRLNFPSSYRSSLHYVAPLLVHEAIVLFLMCSIFVLSFNAPSHSLQLYFASVFSNNIFNIQYFCTLLWEFLLQEWCSITCLPLMPFFPPLYMRPDPLTHGKRKRKNERGKVKRKTTGETSQAITPFHSFRFYNQITCYHQKMFYHQILFYYQLTFDHSSILSISVHLIYCYQLFVIHFHTLSSIFIHFHPPSTIFIH